MNMNVIHGPDSRPGLIPPDRHRNRVALEVLINVVVYYPVPPRALRSVPLVGL
jgi:hypothetical protein